MEENKIHFNGVVVSLLKYILNLRFAGASFFFLAFHVINSIKIHNIRRVFLFLFRLIQKVAMFTLTLTTIYNQATATGKDIHLSYSNDDDDGVFCDERNAMAQAHTLFNVHVNARAE